MDQTNGSMRIKNSLWIGEQAGAGTKLGNANDDEYIYTRPQLFKRWITLSTEYISIQWIQCKWFL